LPPNVTPYREVFLIAFEVSDRRNVPVVTRIPAVTRCDKLRHQNGQSQLAFFGSIPVTTAVGPRLNKWATNGSASRTPQGTTSQEKSEMSAKRFGNPQSQPRRRASKRRGLHSPARGRRPHFERLEIRNLLTAGLATTDIE
jgi:hypothetical protein